MVIQTASHVPPFAINEFHQCLDSTRRLFHTNPYRRRQARARECAPPSSSPFPARRQKDRHAPFSQDASAPPSTMQQSAAARAPLPPMSAADTHDRAWRDARLSYPPLPCGEYSKNYCMDARIAIAWPAVSVSIKRTRNSFAPSHPLIYALKCFFITAKCCTSPISPSKSLMCSASVLIFSCASISRLPSTVLGINRSRLFSRDEKSHGLPKIARPSIAPSAPLSATFARASSKSLRSPLPTISVLSEVSPWTASRISTARLIRSHRAATADISLRVRA